MALLFCAAAIVQAQTVGGVVTNSVTGLPVSGARVSTGSANSISTNTDAAGKFVLRGFPAGELTLTVQRVGIEPLRHTLTIGTQDVLNLDLKVTPAAQMITPVVVTATGENDSRQMRSTTIDMLDGAEIREVRASHPSGILNRIPGVHISELTGEGHSTAIRQPITTKPVYLYLEDGIPTRSTGFFNHNALYEINLPQSNGLEILKGPGTALYGSDAIGGIVNSLTRPAPATPGFEGSVEGGSFGYRRALLSGGGWFGGSGLRADLNYTDSDGWKNSAPYQRVSGTVRWDASLGDNITARTVLTGSIVDQFDVPSIGRADFDADPQLNRAPIAYRRVDAVRLSTAIEKDAGNWLWSITPYARYNVMELLPQWQLTFDPETWDTRNNSLGLVLRYRRDFARLNARVIVGVDAEMSPGSFVADSITPVRSTSDNRIFTSYTTSAQNYDYDVTYRALSPYVHTEFTPLADVRVDLGVRFDASSYDYETNLAPISTGRHRRPENTTVHYRRLSPKAGIAFRVSDAATVFGSYREGFRAPSQGDAFKQNGAESTVDLQPVKVRSYELGVRGNIATRFLYSVSAYDMTARDDILTFTTPTNTREVLNAGRTRHRGVEFGLGAAVLANLRVDVAYSVAEHEYVHWVPRESSIPANRVDYSGNKMEQAPREIANLSTTWTPAFLKGGRASAEWSMLGRYALTPTNERFTNGYSIVNGNFSYLVLPGTELFLRGLNLVDQEYAELITFDAFQGEQITAGMPRSFFLGVKYGWQR